MPDCRCGGRRGCCRGFWTLEVERGGCIVGTEGTVGHLPLVLENLPLSRGLGSPLSFSPLFCLSSARSPCASADGVRRASRSLRCASEHEQMHGGACAGLGLKQCYMCNFLIYTHNQFIISGQNFISCMGRFGPQRDVNSKASGIYERALYVESNSVRLQYTTVVFPSLLVSARRRLRATSSAWAAASAACGWAAAAGANRWRCTDTSAAELCSRRRSVRSLGIAGASEPWLCPCAKAKLGAGLFGFSALER